MSKAALLDKFFYQRGEGSGAGTRVPRLQHNQAGGHYPTWKGWPFPHNGSPALPLRVASSPMFPSACVALWVSIALLGKHWGLHGFSPALKVCAGQLGLWWRLSSHCPSCPSTFPASLPPVNSWLRELVSHKCFPKNSFNPLNGLLPSGLPSVLGDGLAF